MSLLLRLNRRGWHDLILFLDEHDQPHDFFGDFAHVNKQGGGFRVMPCNCRNASDECAREKLETLFEQGDIDTFHGVPLKGFDGQ